MRKHWTSFWAAALLALCSCASSGPTTRTFAQTGDAGKGNSLAILAPAAKGLAKDQDYLPTLVQGELVSNFAAYSTLNVLDRARLDTQYAELYSGL